MIARASQSERVDAIKAERRELTKLVEKAAGRKKLTPMQAALLRRLVNLWIAHRNGEGVIRPGRKRLAKQVGCSVDTVRVALGEFRSRGILRVVRHSEGGRHPTHYTLDLQALREHYGPPIPREAPGVLVEIDRRGPGGNPPPPPGGFPPPPPGGFPPGGSDPHPGGKSVTDIDIDSNGGSRCDGEAGTPDAEEVDVSRLSPADRGWVLTRRAGQSVADALRAGGRWPPRYVVRRARQPDRDPSLFRKAG